MQSDNFDFRRFIMALVSLVFVITLFVAALSVQAQGQSLVRVDGNSVSSGAPTVTSVMPRGPGQGEVTITGVQLKSSLSYCLIGVGHGHWHARGMQVDIDKVACVKPTNNQVVVPLKLDAKYYQAKGMVMGYVPVAVDASGKIVSWEVKPVGSQKFEKNNGKQADIIAVTWTAAGIASLANAEQALTIND